MEGYGTDLNLGDEQEQAEMTMAKLLNCWNIPRCKSQETKQDFDFIASHQTYFDSVLRLCGYGGLTLISNAGREVAYITGSQNLYGRTFNKDESIVLLRLLQEYLRCRTRVSLSGGNADMFVGDLLENINATRRAPMNEKELQKILSALDSYHFVRLDLRKKVDFSKETILTIMPGVSQLLPGATVESIDKKLHDYVKESTKRKVSGGTEESAEESDRREEWFDGDTNS